jgi:phage-related protein
MSTEEDVYIDDVRLQDMGVIVKLDSQEPILPSTIDYTVYIPGRHGAYDYGAYRGPLPFDLECMFQRMSYSDLKVKIREFVELFIDTRGRPKTVKLKFGDEMDKFYWVRFSGSIPLNRLAGMPSFTLPLVAIENPNANFVESSEEIAWDSDTPFMSDVTLDAKYVYDITTPQDLRIHNFGNLIVEPIIEIVGSASSLTLTLNSVSVTIGAFSNSTILIDSKEYIALQNGADYTGEIIDGMTGAFEDFLLETGENIVEVSGSNLNFKITFKFHAQYK